MTRELEILGWVGLSILSLVLSLLAMKSYFISKDTKKLMVALALSPAIVTFLIAASILPQLSFSNPVISNIFTFGAFPLIILFFFTLLQLVPKKQRQTNIFLPLFLSFYLITGLILLLGIMPQTIIIIFEMIGSISIFALTLYLIIRDRHMTNYFFLFSMISFAIGGLSMTRAINNPSNQGYEFLSLFSYYIAYLFLIFIFFHPTFNQTGKSVGSYFSLQKKLQNTEQALNETTAKYRAIVEESTDVIMITQTNGTILYSSPSAKMIFEQESNTLKGKKLQFTQPNGETPITTILSRALIGEKGNDFCYQIVTKNGRNLWLSHSWKPIQTKEKTKLVIHSLRDITEKKKTEALLQEKVALLEKNDSATLNIMEDLQHTIKAYKKAQDEINLKNQQLEMSNRELRSTQQKLSDLNRNLEQKVFERTKEIQHLLKQKEDFVNQLGHDLKTPLTPLIALLPLLLKHEHDPETRELLLTIEKNVIYMKNLVSKTLQLAILNSSNYTLTLRNNNLKDIIDPIIERNQSSIQEKNITIINHINNQVLVYVDELQLSELVQNLLSNAVKYTPAGGSITFDAKLQPSQVLVSITDTGMGIDQQQIPHIFDEFYKADSSRHNLESTGLGLSICKRIIEKHGGHIWVESKGVGQGSTFYFTAPLVESQKEVIQNII